MHDIAPYTCIFEDCRSPLELFVKREQWTEHMRVNHAVSQWFCSNCSFDNSGGGAVSFSTRTDCRDHMVSNHGASFSAAELSLVVELSERSTIAPVSCPLCVNDATLVNIDEDSHIASHLHAFSLRALPWDDDHNDLAVSAGSTDPSQPGPAAEHDDFDDGNLGLDSAEELSQSIRRAVNPEGGPARNPKQEGTLSEATVLRLQHLAVEAAIWMQASSATNSRKEMVISLLRRLLDDTAQLTSDHQEFIQHAVLVADIDQHMDSLEECLHNTARRDDELWQDALKSLSDQTTRAVQLLIEEDQANSNSVPEQLDTLLKLGWEMQRMCDAGQPSVEAKLAASIVDSLQRIGDDESVFMSAPTSLPWAVILSATKVTFVLPLTLLSPDSNLIPVRPRQCPIRFVEYGCAGTMVIGYNPPGCESRSNIWNSALFG